jgi:hypothetical protein
MATSAAEVQGDKDMSCAVVMVFQAVAPRFCIIASSATPARAVADPQQDMARLPTLLNGDGAASRRC